MQAHGSFHLGRDRAPGFRSALSTQRRWIPKLAAPSHCRLSLRRIQVDASEGLSYKDAGVDIDAGNELVKRIQKLNPSIGGFSGLVPFGALFGEVV